MNDKSSPLVSILIPVYNRESVVSRAIESALSQTYRNIEVVICDNYSNDNTWQILKEYAAKDSRINVFQNDSNIGPVKNWKRCLDESNGEYVKFLWSDDTMSKSFIEESVKILEKDTNIGFVYTRTDIILKDKIIHNAYQLGKSGKYKSIDFIKKSALNWGETPVSPGCALFRRDDIVNNLKIDLSNPHNLDFNKYGAGVDLLLFLYTCQKYRYFHYIDKTLSFFYGGNDSFSITHNLNEYYTYSLVYFLKTHCHLYKIKNLFFSTILDHGEYSYMVPTSFILYKKTRKAIKRIVKTLHPVKKS